MYPKMLTRKVAAIRSGLLLGAIVALLTLALPPAAGRAQDNSLYFPETQHSVRGRFLQYWEEHGGLAQQGYPLTEEFQEQSQTNGQTYTVQYFERAVFELHPENAAPNDVQLSLLGVFLYNSKYPDGAPNQQPAEDPGVQMFPETGKFLEALFGIYWQDHGGLAQQGYPISNRFPEKSDLDGKTYMVQYFERAVFEEHDENQPPYNVLLSQLGKYRLDSRYPNNSNPAAAPIAPPPGSTTNPTSTPLPTAAPCPDPAQIPASAKARVANIGPVVIEEVHYTPDEYEGDEYVELSHLDANTVDLSGWTLRDKNNRAHSFTFPANSQMETDELAVVYTMRHTGQAYSFGQNAPIWDDCGAAVELLDAHGQVVATYAYGAYLLP